MDANRLEPHASGQASRPEEINGTVGIFTQTVLPSPVIQWILPARLRSKHHNDVVFVGQQRIQIKEAALGGYLEDVIEKTDFGGSIIQAKALNVSTQLPWESELRTDGIVGGQGVDPDVLDDLPAQILVVTLDLKQILFLCCSRTQNTFITFCRPLPVNVSLPEKFGRHVAVDPKSVTHFLFRIDTAAEYRDFSGLASLRPARLTIILRFLCLNHPVRSSCNWLKITWTPSKQYVGLYRNRR